MRGFCYASEKVNVQRTLLFSFCKVLCCCPISPCCLGQVCCASCASKTRKGPPLSFTEIHAWLNVQILIQCKQRKRKWAEIVIKGNCPGLKAWLQSLKFNGDLRCVHSLCSLRWFLFSVERESEKKRKWKWAKTCGMRRAKGTITGWWACACNGNLRCMHLLCSLWWFRFQCWKRKWNRKRKWK